MKKLPYIDSIRGIAIIGVLMVHCGQNVFMQYPASFQRLIINGARGVQLFFLISAFTIFLSLSREENSKEFSNTNFYIKRFFRIAPMYYIGILYYLFQDYYENGKSSFGSLVVLFNTFFIHGVNPYTINNLVPGGWSITVEVFFYLCVPFLFTKIKNCDDALKFFIITLLGRYFSNLLLVHSDLYSNKNVWQEFIFYYFPNQLPVFAAGIFLFFLVMTTKDEISISLKLLLCVLMIIFVEDFFIDLDLFSDHILFSVFCVYFIYVLSKNYCILLINPLTVFIGKISYSMYLVHFAVLYWINYFGVILMPFSIKNKYLNMVNYFSNLLLLLVLTIIISTFFYYLVEKIFIKLGRKVIEIVDK